MKQFSVLTEAKRVATVNIIFTTFRCRSGFGIDAKPNVVRVKSFRYEKYWPHPFDGSL